MDVVALVHLLLHALQVVFVLANQTLKEASAQLARQDFMIFLIATVRFKIYFEYIYFQLFVQNFLSLWM